MPNVVAICECGRPTTIHATDLDAGTAEGWCVDHAPDRFAEVAARQRALSAFIARWERFLEERKAAGESVPSWRVAAAAAFGEGVKFERVRWGGADSGGG